MCLFQWSPGWNKSTVTPFSADERNGNLEEPAFSLSWKKNHGIITWTPQVALQLQKASVGLELAVMGEGKCRGKKARGVGER